MSRYPYVFYAFGSRVKGHAKTYSDLDLCYKEPIPDTVISQLREELEESNITIKIDILDWNRCDADFQKSIAADLIEVRWSYPLK